MLAGSCPDLRQHLVAEQFDRLEERRVRHAAHVHLDDLPRMAETLVQVENAVGDLVRAAGENHSATLHVPHPTSARHPRTPGDRQSVVSGKSGAVSLHRGGGRTIKTKKTRNI